MQSNSMSNFVNKIFITSILSAAIFGILAFNGELRALAQEGTAAVKKNVTIFISPSCEYCTQLKEDLKNPELSSKLNVEEVDVTVAAGADRYNKVYDSCFPDKETKYVPMMSYDNECFEGRDQVLAKLGAITGVKVDVENTTTGTGNTDNGSNSNSNQPPQNTDKDPEESTIIEDTENLGQRLGLRPLPSTNLSPLNIALMVGIPALFVAASYYMLKKMRL